MRRRRSSILIPALFCALILPTLACGVFTDDEPSAPAPAGSPAAGSPAAGTPAQGTPASSAGVGDTPALDATSAPQAGAAAEGDGVLDLVAVVFATEVNEQGQAGGRVGYVFSMPLKTIYAVVAVDDAEEGDPVSGRWYRLAQPGSPPEGRLISDAGVELTADEISEGGGSFVALNLTATGESLPAGPWLLRVYHGEELLSTQAFFITDASGAQAPPPTATPPPADDTQGGPATAVEPPPTEAPPPTQPPPAPTATPEPRTYTVQAGDTLSSIAMRLRPPGVSVPAFVDALVELNNLTPGVEPTVGRVLVLP